MTQIKSQRKSNRNANQLTVQSKCNVKCNANQLTGFYMTGTSVLKELKLHSTLALLLNVSWAILEQYRIKKLNKQFLKITPYDKQFLKITPYDKQFKL